MEFNGGYFESPSFAVDEDDANADGLMFLSGIGASHEEAELGSDETMALFDDNDPPIIVPIGDTETGSLIVLVTEPDGRGEILYKEAFGGFHYLASGIEEFFALLRENENHVE